MDDKALAKEKEKIEELSRELKRRKQKVHNAESKKIYLKRPIQIDSDRFAKNIQKLSDNAQLRELLTLDDPYIQVRRSPSVNLTLKGEWAKYKNEKFVSGKWKNNGSMADREAYISDFLSICELRGFTIDLSREDAIQVLEDIKKIPARRNLIYPTLTFEESLGKPPKLKDRSVEARLVLIKSFYEWMSVNTNIVSKNPFNGVELKIADTASYATLTPTDIEELFNLPQKLENKHYRFWVPRLCLFTGMRANEALQLTHSDIHITSGKIHYLSVNDKHGKKVKTKSAIRAIPIHDALIDNGFLNYLKKAKNKNTETIWPELANKSAYRALNNYWNQQLKNKGYPSKPTDEFGKRKTFHSLRRVFSNRLHFIEHHDLSALQGILGHEKAKILKETETYLDPLSEQAIVKAKSLIDRLEYPEKINWNQSHLEGL